MINFNALTNGLCFEVRRHLIYSTTSIDVPRLIMCKYSIPVSNKISFALHCLHVNITTYGTNT